MTLDRGVYARTEPQLESEVSKVAASRDTVKKAYKSDIIGPGTLFVRRVDDHFQSQAALGWGINALVGGEFPAPSTLRMRHGVGVDTSGRRHAVVIADVTADLWTRTATTWQILDDAGALDTVTLTGLVGEAVTF